MCVRGVWGCVCGGVCGGGGVCVCAFTHFARL